MYLRYIVIILITATVAACSEKFRDVIDPDVNMSRKEFQNSLIPPKKDTPEIAATTTEPPLPDMSQILVTPQPPARGKDQLVTISITETAPLKDVLIELGRLADIDIELDPRISGGIILKVKDKPLNEVIDRVAQLGGLRYSYDGGILKIERDVPYITAYQVDFLNIKRSNKGSVKVNTSVGSSGGGTGDAGGGVGSGSTNNVESSYDGDLWTSVEEDLTKILEYVRQENNMDVAISTNPTAAPTPKPAGKGASDSQSFVTMNQQAGLINVLATSRQHQDINKYLNSVKSSISSQVLIEAKVVEVTLDDEYRTGINWDLVEKKLGVGITGDFTRNVSDIGDKFGFGVLNQTGRSTGGSITAPANINTIASLTQLFGVSRTLSSPRLHAMNNQQAVLSFAENSVYFSLDVQVTDPVSTAGATTTGGKTVVKSTLKTVPIGIILTLQPSINADTNEITMNIRPTLSRITGTVEDPAVAYIAATEPGAAGLKSLVPIVEVRELDSILKIKSGQVMVIGGLMEERSANNDSGVPFISNIPWAGNLFKSVAKTKNVIQTIIFIKATITPTGNVSPEDKRFYKAFTRDPQPLAF